MSETILEFDAPKERICYHCKVVLTKENAWPSRLKPDSSDSICKDCGNARNRARHSHSKEFYKVRASVMNTILKLEVMCHYSNIPFYRNVGKCPHCGANDFWYERQPPCVKCGIADERVLSLDHIIPIGTKGRKEQGPLLYRWLKKHDYPEGYQVLCMNCQWVKRVQNHEVSRRDMRNV